MKQLLIFTLLISNLFLLNISKEKMILGEWRYVKTVLSIEKIGDNLYQKRTSGFIGKTILEFKANYNGTCINTQTKITNQFTWQINRKKLSLTYYGDDRSLKSFDGEFEIKILNKHKMEILNLKDNKLFIFER